MNTAQIWSEFVPSVCQRSKLAGNFLCAPNDEELKQRYQQRQNKDHAESQRAFQFQEFGV